MKSRLKPRRAKRGTAGVQEREYYRLCVLGKADGDPKRFLLPKDIETLMKGGGVCGENDYTYLKLSACGLIEDERLLLRCRVRWRRTEAGDRFLAERGLLDQPETTETTR